MGMIQAQILRKIAQETRSVEVADPSAPLGRRARTQANAGAGAGLFRRERGSAPRPHRSARSANNAPGFDPRAQLRHGAAEKVPDQAAAAAAAALPPPPRRPSPRRPSPREEAGRGAAAPPKRARVESQKSGVWSLSQMCTETPSQLITQTPSQVGGAAAAAAALAREAGVASSFCSGKADDDGSFMNLDDDAL